MKDNLDPSRQPLLAHVIELRNRLIWSLLAIMVLFFVCYAFAPQIYGFLVHPLAVQSAAEGKRLIYTGLAEAFMTYVKLALWAACLLAFPFVATQIWLFIAPGLYKHERTAFLPFLVATPILFLLGAALAYFFAIPVAWHFFLSFELPGGDTALPIQLEARVSEYLSLTMTFIMAFGVAFLLPVLLVLLVRIGVLSVDQLVRSRRYAIVIIFIIAAVLTPPDVLSQFMMAIPLMVLYELSILAARAMGKKEPA